MEEDNNSLWRSNGDGDGQEEQPSKMNKNNNGEESSRLEEEEEAPPQVGMYDEEMAIRRGGH